MARSREALAAQAPAPPVRRGKRDPLEGLAEEAIATFAKPLDEPPETEVNIKNVAFRGSYSWLEADEPTIAVPGSPRVWKNRPLPYTVPADSGRSFIDQNGFRIPSCPMLPLFVAVDTLEARSEQPKLEWATLDFITDRNNLLKLAGFILPKLSNKKKFRIDLEFVGSRTIVMQKWEESNVVWSHGNGYGDSFERETTTPGPGCEQSSLAGHTRITSYDFSGLKMLVRCEVDACYPSGDSEDEDKLVEALSTLDVSHEPSASSDTALTTVLNLHVVRAGRVVPQPALIKLKTRSSSTYQGFSWDGPYVQLLLGQTPTLIVGLHKNGTFEKLHERELDTSAYENAKQRTEPALKKLRRLLEDIHTAVLKHGRGVKLSIVTDSGILKLVERTDDKVLPDEVVRRFDV